MKKWKKREKKIVNASNKSSTIQETKTFTTVSWFAACLSNKTSDKFGKEMNSASTQTTTGHGCKQLLTHSYSHLLLKVNMLHYSRQRRSKRVKKKIKKHFLDCGVFRDWLLNSHNLSGGGGQAAATSSAVWTADSCLLSHPPFNRPPKKVHPSASLTHNRLPRGLIPRPGPPVTCTNPPDK